MANLSRRDAANLCASYIRGGVEPWINVPDQYINYAACLLYTSDAADE